VASKLGIFNWLNRNEFISSKFGVDIKMKKLMTYNSAFWDKPSFNARNLSEMVIYTKGTWLNLLVPKLFTNQKIGVNQWNTLRCVFLLNGICFSKANKNV